MKKSIHFPKSANPRVPDSDIDFHHMIELQTRFNDADMLGHLNNTVYLSFMDLGKTSYFSEIMGGRVDWKNIDTVVVHVECDYFAPSFIDEPLAVATVATHIGVHSFKLEQRVFNTATGQIKCLGRTVMAGFDPATGSSKVIDPAWVAAIEKYEGRAIAKRQE